MHNINQSNHGWYQHRIRYRTDTDTDTDADTDTGKHINTIGLRWAGLGVGDATGCCNWAHVVHARSFARSSLMWSGCAMLIWCGVICCHYQKPGQAEFLQSKVDREKLDVSRTCTTTSQDETRQDITRHDITRHDITVKHIGVDIWGTGDRTEDRRKDRIAQHSTGQDTTEQHYVVFMMSLACMFTHVLHSFHLC